MFYFFSGFYGGVGWGTDFRFIYWGGGFVEEVEGADGWGGVGLFLMAVFYSEANLVCWTSIEIRSNAVGFRFFISSMRPELISYSIYSC